jgi:hypothetical protein
VESDADSGTNTGSSASSASILPIYIGFDSETETVNMEDYPEAEKRPPGGESAGLDAVSRFRNAPSPEPNLGPILSTSVGGGSGDQ